MTFQDVFKRIHGREPKTEEILKFERLTTALETAPNDALLAVLVALDHYENLYAKIPGKITETVSKTLIDFRASADIEAAASIAEAKADLAKAVSEAAVKVARNTATRNMMQWVVICVIVVFASFDLFGWYMHSSGKDSGYQAGYGAGYTEAKDEKAAAAWANTPEGRLAYRFAQSGELQRLARCEGKGWKVEKGACYPYPVPNEGTYGWALP